MKIHFNIPKMDKIKEKAEHIKAKIKNNKSKETKVKVPLKYYALLVSMVLVGTLSLAININKYKKVNKEEYIEYLPDTKSVMEGKVEIKEYEVALSSMSTNVSTMPDIKTQSVINTDTYKDEEYVWPLKGEIIKEYAMETLAYSKTLDMWKIHPGIDIKADIGESVKSVQEGVVTKIENTNFYGNSIYITHEDGYTSVYSNLAAVSNVTEGDRVERNQEIASVGASANGEIKEDSHLHFEILKGLEQINPLELLK